MRCRVLLEKDLPQVAELERLCFSAPWSEAALSVLTREGAFGLVCLDECDKVIGYVGVMTVLDEGQITNLATHPAHRRRGVATELLRTLSELGREKGICTLSLEVRESNAPAISLYERHGFFVAGKRRNFYTAPREAALVMLCNLTNEG